MQNASLFTFIPAKKTPHRGFISIPHSGMHIPHDFKDYLISNEYELNRDVDFAVDKLIDIEKINNHGISILISNIHRTCCDLNRARNEAILNWKKNSHQFQIVTNSPDKETEEKLLREYFDPYYIILKNAITKLEESGNKELFIDLHSMPSRATKYHLEKNPHQREIRPSFCLSDRHGMTADQDFMKYALNTFQENFPDSTINDPYQGGNITLETHQALKSEDSLVSNIQIEISRSQYMSEEKQILLENTSQFKIDLTEKIIKLFRYFHSDI